MTEQWQKVSPIAIIYFLISGGIKFVKDLALNMTPVIVLLMVSVEDKVFWLSISALLISSALILGSILYYFSFRFKVIEEQVIVHKGIFNKEDISLKFDRIQNVNVSIPWYFTPFKLVNCILDSAGSTSKEIIIPGIDIGYAEELSKKVHSFQHQQTENQEKDIHLGEVEISEPTLRIGPKEIIKYSLTNTVILIFAAALFPFIQKFVEKLDLNIKGHLSDIVELLPLPKFAAILVVFFTMLFLLLVVLMSISVVTSLIRFYRYEFYHEPKRLRRVAGLLERHQISIRKQKIQGITIKQNIIARLFNRVTLQIHQTQGSQINPAVGSKQRFIIPMLEADQWQSYASMAFSDFKAQELEFRPIERSYLYRNFRYFVLLPVLMLITVLSFNFSLYHLSWLFLLPLGWLLCWQKYRRYGVWHDQNFVVIRAGFLGINYTLFPLYKLQQVVLVQTLLQKPKEVAKLKLQLAFVRLSIPYLKQSFAEALMNLALYKIESTTKKWL